MTALLLLLLAPAELAVEGYRPPALAVEELERRHGWHVSYEEARWPTSSAPQGRIRFQYQPQQGPEAVLRSLLAAHDEQGNTGSFALVRIAPAKWSVVLRLLDSRPVPAPLDTPVTIDPVHRPVGQAEQILSAQLARAAGYPVGLGGGVAVNFWMHQSTRIATSAEPARTVLERMYRTMEAPSSLPLARYDHLWHLYCDGDHCYVNLRPRHGSRPVYPPGMPAPPPR